MFVTRIEPVPDWTASDTVIVTWVGGEGWIAQSAGEFEVEIETGSSRRKNYAQRVDTATQLMKNALPIFVSAAQTTGQWGPVNAVMQTWFEAIEVDMPEQMRFEMPPPQPAMPDQGPEVGSTPGQEASPQQQGGAPGAAAPVPEAAGPPGGPAGGVPQNPFSGYQQAILPTM